MIYVIIILILRIRGMSTQKQKKKKAFTLMSFIDKPSDTSSPSKEDKGNRSEHQQVMEQQFEPLQQCNVCHVILGPKKRSCGVCKFNICGQHLRKKRKDKNGTWARICDDCQDRYLYDVYMKFELKAEQGLKMQQQIMQKNIQQSRKQLTGKTSKVSMLKDQKENSQKSHQQIKKKLTNICSELQSKLSILEQQQTKCQQENKRLDQIEKQLPPPLQQDFQILIVQNEKVTKQLVRSQKQLNEIIQTISLKEKEINEAYEIWERNFKAKKIKQKESCKIQ